MFGLEYIAALVRVLFQVAFAFVSAVPFFLAWNRVSAKFFAFLPEVWSHVSYWEMVSLILVSMLIGEIVGRITPTLFEAKSSTTNNAGTA